MGDLRRRQTLGTPRDGSVAVMLHHLMEGRSGLILRCRCIHGLGLGLVRISWIIRYLVVPVALRHR